MINLCPKCGAFCNPDTGECLACGEIHYNLIAGHSLKPGKTAWYTLPIETEEGKQANFTFYGTPNIVVKPTHLKIPSMQEGELKINFIPRDINGTTCLFTMRILDE